MQTACSRTIIVQIPPPMQFMMTEMPVPENAEVAVLLGLHQKLGGPFKLVYLFKRYKCVHVYECVSQGREWWYTLHMTTDARYCLRDMQPFTGPRQKPPPEWWERGAGSPYPMGVNGHLVNDISDPDNPAPTLSVVVKRDAGHEDNLSGGQETLVPSRLLYGLVPECLLEQYRFWQDERVVPPLARPHEAGMASRGGAQGYKHLRGYPVHEGKVVGDDDDADDKDNDQVR